MRRRHAVGGVVLTKITLDTTVRERSTDSGNQSCPEASIPDPAVRIIRLFEELSLGPRNLI
jgi:hypothetical protein